MGMDIGFTLKMIAVISMFIDHLGATVLERILFGGSLGASAAIYVNAHWDGLHQLYMVMRGIGRLAFPIYCFLLVEGFLHTRSVPARRLIALVRSRRLMRTRSLCAIA